MPPIYVDPELERRRINIAKESTNAHRFLARYIQNHVMRSCGKARDLTDVAPVYLELAHTLATDEETRKEFLRILDLAI